MKILLIAQEPPLTADAVVSGNAIRTRQLTRGLERAGHTVVHCWLDPKGANPGHAFRNRDDLRGLLMRENADVHLVCYWELLDLMPFESDTPVVLDFLAPRPLETVFEDPSGLRRDLRRLQADLAKVDLLLTGNEFQKAMMLLPLLETGLDLTRDVGALVVPLGAEIAGQPHSDPTQSGWTFVSGGVNWPWRNAEPYLQQIDHALDKAPEAELVLFGGGYVLQGEHGNTGGHTRQMNPLMAYQEFSAWLLDNAHVGLELAEDNIERRFSQSFRSVEFLRHGLPLICNAWLPIASLIEEYDAGWLVEGPTELPSLIQRIVNDPESWRKKSDNALRLARARLNETEVLQPLIDWLAQAHKAQRLPREIHVPAELRVPPWRERLQRMADLRHGFYHPSLEQGTDEPEARKQGSRLRIRALNPNPLVRNLGASAQRGANRILNVARSPVFYLQRLLFRPRQHQGVVLITRGDIFPADHGAAVKIVETARGLSFQGLPVALVTDNRKYWWQVTAGDIEQKRLPWWIRLMSPSETASKALHYSKDIPLNNAFLYLPMSDRSFFYRALYAGRKVGARVLQAEFPAYVRPAVHARHILDTKLVLVEHNVEYDRIRSQVEELTDAQYARYKAIEIDLCNQCDAVICVSDNDRQKLAMDGVDLDRLYTVPHGVDLDQFRLPPLDGVRERFGIPQGAPVLVYHGTFSYPPNLQALRLFANELLPRLENKGLECHVLAVGREAPANSPHPRIHLTGSVDKVGPWIKAADLAVVPLLDGGGTRMKIIDCFAAGTPVISTSKGIEGIPVVNGQHALVIDDWDEMAGAIEALLGDRPRAGKMAAAARELADAMDWKAIAGRYVEIFDQLESPKPD
jgi:glycosyltransferase involved in cell wall biosynthesis